jgi:hypothetical protein
MSLFNLNVEKSKKSLIVRNEIIEKLYNELGINFSYSFNDLYSVKNGVVRRLKGGIWNREMYEKGCNKKEFNDVFDKVKDFIENLEFEGFKIELNKKMNYSWNGYMWVKKNGFEGDFLEYKEKSIYNEGELILKIKWSV